MTVEKTAHQRTRIAFVVHSVLQVRWFMVPHLRLLAERFDVTLLLNNDYPEELAALNLPVRIVEIPIERKISPFSDLRTLLVLTRFFMKEHFAAVHTVTPKSGLLGTLAGFLARVPVRIHTFQGEPWATRQGVMRWLLRSLDSLVARLATHLTTVSHGERDFLEANGVLPTSKAEVLGAGSFCGVDVERFKPDPSLREGARKNLGIPANTCAFIYVGRLCTDKGIPTLADAARLLMTEMDDVSLIVVGPDEGGMTELLHDRLDAVAGDRLKLFPFSRTPEALITAADVLVLPSVREGFGMVILEAGAMGLPAVGTDIYGIRDALMKDETGLVFRSGDAADLAAKMRLFAGDADLRRQFGARARERVVRDFSQHTILAAFDAFYRSLPIEQAAPR